MSDRRPFRLLALLVLAYTACTLLQITLTAPFEGADEGQHLAYIIRLMRGGGLPNRARAADNPTRQTSGQPPLYYAVAALLIRPFDDPAALDDAALFDLLRRCENRWYAPPDPFNLSDNRNVYTLLYHRHPADAHAIDAALRLMFAGRVVSWLFGLAGVLAAYAAAGAVWIGRPGWRLTTTALFAFTPQYIQMSAIVHNDIAGVVLAVAVSGVALWLVRAGASRGRLVTLGVLIGLAGMAKLNALAVVPGAGAALLLSLWTPGDRFRVGRAVRAALYVGVPAAVIALPWVIDGALRYGDPLGTATHYRPGYFYPEPLSLTAIVPLLPEVVLSYWGKLGSAVYLPREGYVLLGAGVLLAVAGLVRAPRRAWDWVRREWRIVLVLLLIALASALALVHWLRTIHFITGRLAYPAHLGYALVLTGGAALIAGRIGQGVVIAIALIASAVASPIALIAAFAPVETRAALPAGLVETAIDFAPSADALPAIRFIGHVPPDVPLISGELVRYTLCWSAQEGAPPDRAAAFSLKLFSQSGEQVADRTSLLGMGRYPSGAWRAGDRVCDAVDLPISGALMPGAVYNLIIVLLDAETLAVDWTAREPDGTPIAIPLIAGVTP